MGAVKNEIEFEQNLERVEREEMWREDRKSMKIEINIREQILKDVNRELEIMRYVYDCLFTHFSSAVDIYINLQFN